MSKIDTYVNYAMSVANDNTKGYSQQRRRIAQTQEEVDEIKDGDCSTIVLNGLVLAGIDIANATYTGNMTSALLAAGFQDRYRARCRSTARRVRQLSGRRVLRVHARSHRSQSLPDCGSRPLRS